MNPPVVSPDYIGGYLTKLNARYPDRMYNMSLYLCSGTSVCVRLKIKLKFGYLLWKYIQCSDKDYFPGLTFPCPLVQSNWLKQRLKLYRGKSRQRRVENGSNSDDQSTGNSCWAQEFYSISTSTLPGQVQLTLTGQFFKVFFAASLPVLANLVSNAIHPISSFNLHFTTWK